MDFAALMSAQISKAKSSTPTDGKSKYLRRADLEAEREAAYAAEQAKIEAEREERLTKKRKIEEEEAEHNRLREEKRRKLAEESKIRKEQEEQKQEALRRKRLGLPLLPERSAENGSKEGTPLPPDEKDIPESELLAKLRSLNAPATLFNEDHIARLKRYHKLTQQALKPQFAPGPIPTTLTPVPEADMKIPEAIPSDPTALSFLYRQLASYFTLLLTEWSNALASRSASVKSSADGKRAASIYTACVSDLRPFYAHLESQDLDPGVLGPVCAIVRAAQERRYVDANDLYLTLSIGKAAWPIGVTMVGIHERSAREKLHESDKQAHIMSDESTRKYLQSIKRCLSFAQTRWPPDDIGQLMG